MALAALSAPLPRIPIELAQREFQARWEFVSGTTVQWPSCGCSAAPFYPKDGFYGDLDANPELALRLVQDLLRKFYVFNVGSGRLYEYFTAGALEGVTMKNYITNSAARIWDAWDWKAYNFSPNDFAAPEPEAITLSNYVSSFYDVFSRIQQLRNIALANGTHLQPARYWSFGTNEIRSSSGSAVTGSANTACEGAKGMATELWAGSHWTQPTGMPYLGVENLGCVAYIESATNWSGLAYLQSVRGRITADYSVAHFP